MIDVVSAQPGGYRALLLLSALVLAMSACTTASLSPRAGTPAFEWDLNSGLPECALVTKIEAAVRHGSDTPGYLDCVTGFLLMEPNGAIWFCSELTADSPALCVGRRLRVTQFELSSMPGIFRHEADQVRWTDQIQLLGRVRFV